MLQCLHGKQQQQIIKKFASMILRCKWNVTTVWPSSLIPYFRYGSAGNQDPFSQEKAVT